jgi:hypothetical protein
VERLAKETVFRQKAVANKRSGAMAAGMHYIKGVWSRASSSTRARPWTTRCSWTRAPSRTSIKAKNAPYLVFFWPKVGRVVHFKSVNHPGNKAYVPG